MRKWLSQHFQPQIAVFSSKLTQAKMLEVNGITPAEFLRPFGEVGNLSNYQVKTVDKNEPYRLEKFRVNFVDSHRMTTDSKESARVAERIFQQCRPKIPDNAHQIPTKKQDIQNQLLDLLGPSRLRTEQTRTPWFTLWKKQFFQSVRYPNPPYELTHQPLCFIYFLSVEDSDPLSVIDMLRSPENLPVQYRSGMYDNSKNSIRQFVFILNDTSDERKVQDTTAAVKGQFDSKSIFEIKMSGNLAQNQNSQSQSPTLEDKWTEFIDIDLRQFDAKQTPKGSGFTYNDRQLATQVVRRIIEKYLLPFAIQKIQNVEQNIRKNRAGKLNMFKNFFKESERGDNDGVKQNFKMNRNELELRNLIDLAFVIQDYQTCKQYVDFPADDFKKIKAFQHGAHCDELKMYSRLCVDREFATSQFKEFLTSTNQVYDLYYKVHNDSSHSIIKSSLMMIEVFQSFEKYQESSQLLVKIANVIPDRTVLKPLLYEQASYEFLMQQQFRKAAFYMSLAGQGFEKLNLNHHAFNCFQIIHPFYQDQKGWNDIRLKLYSSLSEFSSITKINQDLAVQYYRNLLQLSSEFPDISQQRQCLNTCFVAFGKFQQEKNGDEKGEIGQLQLPEILAHTVEVFTDCEKVFTNLHDNQVPPMTQAGEGPNNLVGGQFLNFSGKKASAKELSLVQQAQTANKKSDLNQNGVLWRFLDKKVCTYMKKRFQETLKEACYTTSLDQLTELAIYDAQHQQEKQETTFKKERKVFAGQPITVRMIMRNPLMTEIQINKVSLVCKYTENSKDDDFECDQNEYKIAGKKSIEVILKVIPKRPGQIIIEKVQWELLGLFRCEMPFVQSATVVGGQSMPKQLVQKEKTFIYKVLGESAEVKAQIKMKNEFQNLVFTETDQGELIIKNMSTTHAIKNVFAICSHPVVFGFKCKQVSKDEIGPNQEVSLPIDFRASLNGSINVRFLIRYEVVDTLENEVANQCKYRFQRLMLFLNCNLAFKLTPNVHLSMKENDQYLINFQTHQKISATWYDRPRLTSIEIVRGQNNWTLSKKDVAGNFVTVSSSPEKGGNSILVFKKDDLIDLDNEEHSILKNANLTNLLKLEVEYIDHIKQQSSQVDPSVGVDMIVRWQMAKRTMVKNGFFTFVGLKILNQKLEITETQQKLQTQYRMNEMMSTGIQRKTKKEAVQIKKEIKSINPVQVTYHFEPKVAFNFDKNKTAIVPLTIQVQNLLQTGECTFDCQLIADSDNNSDSGFIWVGKTTFQMKDFKPNETRKATLKAGIFKEGIYNLNRFKLTITQHSQETSANITLMPDIKMKDLMMVEVIKRGIAERSKTTDMQAKPLQLDSITLN